MLPFDFQVRTRFIFGPHTVDQLGSLARELDGRRALVVSDPGIVAAGHAQRGIDSLQQAGLVTQLFSGACENPSTREVDEGVALARSFQPDILIGLGGGSSMDCAKGINFVYTNGGTIKDYWGIGKARQPLLPMIAVPTTSGTGSESQSFALISDSETHVKMACGDKKASFRIAVLDPVLTLTQPPGVTALTGLDALAHALETYVTKPRNPVSLAFSREAWRLLASNFARVLDAPEDLEARSAMQIGACLAGLAIENSMLGATHALANPLTAHYGVVHGQAIALMLPHVIRFNGQQTDSWYSELVATANGAVQRRAGGSGTEALAEFVQRLVERTGLASRLGECQVQPERLPELASDAAKQWTGTFNPRAATVEDYLALYQQAY